MRTLGDEWVAAFEAARQVRRRATKATFLGRRATPYVYRVNSRSWQALARRHPQFLIG